MQRLSKTNKFQLCRWRMKDVVGRFSPIRPKLGLKGSLKRRRKDEGEENGGRIREVPIKKIDQNVSLKKDRSECAKKK